MHDPQGIDHDAPLPTEDEVTDGDTVCDVPTGASLMSVLTAANPPVARNARLIRAIGPGASETARYRMSLRAHPAQPEVETGSAPAQDRRAVRRARRKLSLRAAAGLE